jgi:hypothetical protein
MDDVSIGIAGGELVPITGVKINAKLPQNRRYLRPEAVAFARELDVESGHRIVIDSAIRPADVQRRLIRFNKNAAPYDGYRAPATSAGRRLTSLDEALKCAITASSWQGFGTTEQSVEFSSLKNGDVSMSSSEQETT